MRYFEIASGFRLPVYSEEQELLDKIPNGVNQDELDEREQELARLMVSRGVLAQSINNGMIRYKPNSAANIWRDKQ